MTRKFEYKSYQEPLSDERLNKLGAEGWELVSHTAVFGGTGGAQYYIFKREIINESK